MEIRKSLCCLSGGFCLVAGHRFRGLLNGAYLHGVESDSSRPGRPTDNAFIQAFNGRLRQKYLNENWFLSLEDVEK